MFGMGQGMNFGGLGQGGMGYGGMRGACCPQPVYSPPVGGGVGIGIIAVAILILIALGVIF